MLALQKFQMSWMRSGGQPTLWYTSPASQPGVTIRDRSPALPAGSRSEARERGVSALKPSCGRRRERQALSVNVSVESFTLRDPEEILDRGPIRKRTMDAVEPTSLHPIRSQTSHRRQTRPAYTVGDTATRLNDRNQLAFLPARLDKYRVDRVRMQAVPQRS